MLGPYNIIYMCMELLKALKAVPPDHKCLYMPAYAYSKGSALSSPYVLFCIVAFYGSGPISEGSAPPKIPYCFLLVEGSASNYWDQVYINRSQKIITYIRTFISPAIVNCFIYFKYDWINIFASPHIP